MTPTEERVIDQSICGNCGSNRFELMTRPPLPEYMPAIIAEDDGSIALNHLCSNCAKAKLQALIGESDEAGG